MADLKGKGHWLLAAGVLALGIPVLAQGGPESILPPGFGEASPEPAQPASKAPPPPGAQTAPAKTPTPAQAAEAEIAAGAKALPDEPNAANQPANAVEAIAAKYDLPATSRRSLTQIGPLAPIDGGFAPDAFGKTRGPFLAGLMRTSHAPFVSRWAGVMLRRALLSDTTTPSEINGADWVAERAWLLLRMGEADAARLLVQNVDTDQYTARLYAIAMQAQLATADPAGLCPLLPRALNYSDEPSWEMTQAICASFSADQGAASAALNRAQRRGTARGIDYRLAEKAVGAGPNSRRSVKIEWDGVDHLTTWRFGLATATNVEIPDTLFKSVGAHVRAWEARAPTIPLARRQMGVSVATRLGVFSGAAARTYFAQLAQDADAGSAGAEIGDLLRTAYAGEAIDERVAAMRKLWSRTPVDRATKSASGVDYAMLPVISRAAAGVMPTGSLSADSPWLIAAMLSTGLDRNAAKWLPVVDALDDAPGLRAWALLATGAPDSVTGVSKEKIAKFTQAFSASDGHLSQMLVAGLAGLGRLASADTNEIMTSVKLDVQPRSRWAKAIEAAAGRQERGTVALLAAVGMQAKGWANMPANQLYFITAALKRVGMDAEARMIAAEAMARG